MDNELVEVARFPSSFEASLALHELEEAGISARLTNEAGAEWMTYLGTQDVGVALVTHSKYAGKARSLLERREQGDTIQDRDEEEDQIESEEEGEDNEGNDPRDWARRALLAAFFGLFVFPFSLYAIWIVIRHGLLLKRNMASSGIPLTALVMATVGLVVNLLLIVGQFFR